MPAGVDIRGEVPPGGESMLSPPALAFAAHLHRMFEETRQALLRARAERRLWRQGGAAPDFAAETSAIRDGHWQVAPPPAGLAGRTSLRIGPSDRRSIAAASAALPADAKGGAAGLYAASLEDATAPSFHNLLAGQAEFREAAAAPHHPPLLLVPRGWHLPEAHLLVDGAEISASIFDFALSFFHNAQAMRQRGATPFFLLPKMEHFLEARLWHNIFVLAQSILGLPLGSLRAMVMIETVPGALMAEEMLYELRDHAPCLGLDGTDYLFSYLKTFDDDATRLLADRAECDDDRAGHGADSPLVAACARHLRRIGQRRGAATIGVALQNGAAPAVFQNGGDPAVLQNGGGPAASADDRASAAELFAAPPAGATSAGLARNVFVAIGVLAAWLRGEGHIQIDGRPADIAAAELCRARLWQWRRHGAILEDGTVVTGRRLNSEIKAQLGRWKEAVGDEESRRGQYREAATILLDLVLEQQLPEFLTLPCYRRFLAA